MGKKFTSPASLIFFGFLLVVTLLAAFIASPTLGAASKVDELALSEISANGRTNVFIKMATDVSLKAADSMVDRVGRLNYVHDSLTAHANSSQGAIKTFLDSQGAQYQSFWINNSLYVYDADLALVNALAQRGDVAYIRGDHRVALHRPVTVQESTAAPQAIEWGVDLINAPDVWDQGNRGAGIVVANNDTGVRYTHDAVDDQYRGAGGDHNYNWWDPQQGNPGSQTTAPNDGNGHGTHTMGTMVGDDGGSNQIGVAPEAQWIAAKGCASSFCTDFDLISAAQWLACPTDLNGANPDCSQAPHVINNSWGGGGGDNWYASYVQAWVSAGIMPVFSIGNSGPSCNTAGSPGDYKKVIGVGAININSVLASFSSKGPGIFVKLKPQVVAPGENVRSSFSTSDTAYALLSGTSMAAPHVAGTIALMIADTPGATIVDLTNALFTTTVQGLPDPPNPDTCGGRSYTIYPNAIYGHGRIDALAAVNALP
jgi:subtilisin family serine protease